MANPVRARREADLWERYLRLAPGPKSLFHLKSLVFQPTHETEFRRCLNLTAADYSVA